MCPAISAVALENFWKLVQCILSPELCARGNDRALKWRLFVSQVPWLMTISERTSKLKYYAGKLQWSPTVRDGSVWCGSCWPNYNFTLCSTLSCGKVEHIERPEVRTTPNVDWWPKCGTCAPNTAGSLQNDMWRNCTFCWNLGSICLPHFDWTLAETLNCRPVGSAWPQWGTNISTFGNCTKVFAQVSWRERIGCYWRNLDPGLRDWIEISVQWVERQRFLETEKIQEGPVERETNDDFRVRL